MRQPEVKPVKVARSSFITFRCFQRGSAGSSSRTLRCNETTTQNSVSLCVCVCDLRKANQSAVACRDCLWVLSVPLFGPFSTV